MLKSAAKLFGSLVLVGVGFVVALVAADSAGDALGELGGAKDSDRFRNAA
jgi:gas vesicle protein